MRFFYPLQFCFYSCVSDCFCIFNTKWLHKTCGASNSISIWRKVLFSILLSLNCGHSLCLKFRNHFNLRLRNIETTHQNHFLESWKWPYLEKITPNNTLHSTPKETSISKRNTKPKKGDDWNCALQQISDSKSSTNMRHTHNYRYQIMSLCNMWCDVVGAS
jgi:hypothetical protein